PARAEVPDDKAVHIRYATFLSYALTDQGDFEEAARIGADALSEAAAHTDPYTRVRLYWSLARLNVLNGRAAEALEYIRSAIALLKATDDTMTLARAHLLAAGAELRGAAAGAAKENLDAAEKLLGAHPEPADLGMLLIGKSRLAALNGDSDGAVEDARRALGEFGDFDGAEQGSAVH